MNKYALESSKKSRSKQLRIIQVAPMEKIKSKKKVSFRIGHKTLHDDLVVVDECRRLFRKEIAILGQEVMQFRETCAREMLKCRVQMQVEIHKATAEKMSKQVANEMIEDLNKNHSKPELQEICNTSSTKENIKGMIKADPASVEEKWSEQFKILQDGMDYLAKKQSQLDRECTLADEEENLIKRKAELEQYEKEIDEIESNLDRRQERCQKRQNDLFALEEELDRLKIDLEKKKDTLDSLGVDTSEINSRTKNNLQHESKDEKEHIRDNLIEKQSFLQKKIDQYRTELATIKSTCTAKDISIQKLHTQIKELQDELEKKNSKIEQLDTRLSFALAESKATEKEITHKPLSRSNSRVKQFFRQGSFLKKQDQLQEQSSVDSEGRDKVSSTIPIQRKSVKHPMRQSIDFSNTTHGFQMGIQPPTSGESSTCSMM